MSIDSARLTRLPTQANVNTNWVKRYGIQFCNFPEVVSKQAERPDDAANALKVMARKKDAKLGHFIVEFATPGIGHILKAAGCDFALFDLEHSGFGFETVKSAIRYFEAADVAPIVRVPSKEYHHIARACDMGAEGIMIPMVGNAREARAIVDCMKYFPKGKRGVALGVAE